MKRLRIRLKNLSETKAAGRFSSRDKSLSGFDIEEVRLLQPGDSPTSSSFDALKSAIYKRYFVRIRRSERAARVLFALDNSRSMVVGSGELTKREVMFKVAEGLAEAFSYNADEIGYVVWSSTIEKYLRSLSGAQRFRERLFELSVSRTYGASTKPGKLFEYLAELLPRPNIVFVLSDWQDAGDFAFPLGKCFALKLDIVPVVIRDSSEKSIPWILGDVLLKGSESGETRYAYGVSADLPAVKTLKSMSVDFVEIDASSSEEEWDKAFDSFFETRERR